MFRAMPTLLIVLGVFAAPTFAADYIPWAGDLQSARRQAAEQNKIVLIHFYGDHCGPCRTLEANVFSMPEVGGAVGAVCIPVKVNVDRQPEIAEHFRVRQWPTDVFMTASGQAIFSTVSPQQPEKYVAMVQQVAYRGRPDAQPDASFASHRGSQTEAQLTQATQPRSQAQLEQAAQSTAPIGGAFQPEGGSYEPQGGTFGGSFQPQGGSFDAGRQSFGEPSNPRTQPQTAPVAGVSSQQWSQSQLEANRPFETSSAGAASQPRTSWSPAPTTGQGGSEFIENQFVDNRRPPSAMVENPHMRQPAPGPAATVASAPRRQGEVDLSQPAMGGYCPVNLVEEPVKSRKWAKGDPKFGAIHRGRLYLFASAENKAKFLADPDRFSPMLSGYDPVRYVEEGRLVAGQHKIGVFFREKFYLFEEESTLERFKKSPETYAASAHQAMLQSPPMRR